MAREMSAEEQKYYDLWLGKKPAQDQSKREK